MKRNILTVAAVLVSCMAFAQNDTLKAVVNVESDYNPVVMPVKKIGFTPEAAEGGREAATEFFLSGTSMPYGGFVSEKSTKELLHKATDPYDGYLRAGYGVVNELDVKAAYNYDITGRDNVNAFLSLDGYKRMLDGEIYDWQSRLYNTSVGMNYSHAFDCLRLDVDAGLDNMVFNYQDAGFNNQHTDKQNSMNYHVGVGGISLSDGPFAYGFNAGYTRSERKYSSDMEQGINENVINVSGMLKYGIKNAELKELGLDIEVNTFLYNGVLRKGGYGNYVSVGLAPYLDFNIMGWQLRLGTSMNIRSANGAVFAIAPDLRLKKDFSDNIQFYVSATGGRKDNSFAKMQSITPYWGYEQGAGMQLKPTYKVVDAKVGSTINVEPFMIEMTGGYAYTKDDLLQTMHVSQNAFVYSNFAQQNTHNAHAFLRLGYDLGGWLNVSGDARYDFWTCDNKDLLVLTPEITCNVNAEARLFRNLTVNAGYNFTRYTKSAGGKRVSSRNDLNLKVAYQFTPWIGAYLQGDNLLNDTYYEAAGYYARGARGVIGVTVNF